MVFSRLRSTRSRDDPVEPFPEFDGDQSPPRIVHSQVGDTTQSVTTTTTTTTTIPEYGEPTTFTTTSVPSPPSQASRAPAVVVPQQSDRPTTVQTTVAAPTQVARQRPIGIKRLSSATSSRQPVIEDGVNSGAGNSGRNRSSSAPQRYLTVPGSTPAPPAGGLPTLEEHPTTDPEAIQPTSSHIGRRRSVSNAARSILSKFSNDGSLDQQEEYGNNVVDFLDVIDPEVSTLTTLTNVQNSLFVPDLGKWLNRRPTYTLSPARTDGKLPADTTAESRPPPVPPKDEESLETPLQRTWSWRRSARPERTHSISSVLTESHYAVLPHGETLEGWSEEDKECLDDHVRHMLHSKRSKFKQSMKAFGKYVQKPLGFCITLYATLITLFGLAWVLFLIGWIYVGDKQLYVVNVIDNVLVALFAIMGDGLAPFRAVDTYHMIYIAHYHHLSWKLRRQKALPELHDHNDLPEQREKEADPSSPDPNDSEFSVLSPHQQKKLIHHQTKFSNSHSFYKPHETNTHFAFPLRLLVAIVVLLDCHSLFQIALGTCTWAIDYHTRPQALTATILCCSITVNITAGVLITIGDRKTRKKEVVMKMARQEITQQAIKKVQKHKAEREENLHRAENEGNFEVIQEEPSRTSR